MKEKVTSFEISKKLHELGFESDSHCGWWLERPRNSITGNQMSPVYFENWQYEEWIDMPEGVYSSGYQAKEGYTLFKAYDCWDLFIFLKNHEIKEDLDLDFDFYFSMRLSKFRAWWDYSSNRENIDDSQPQNALGLAVIKILEEKGVNNANT